MCAFDQTLQNVCIVWKKTHMCGFNTHMVCVIFTTHMVCVVFITHVVNPTHLVCKISLNFVFGMETGKMV